MEFRQIGQTLKTFVLVFERGDELANKLSEFAERQSATDGGAPSAL
jgi:hypothetical protein